ncbi:MAG: hypothetical protein ACR2LR_23635 [Hassallia sp.]
MTRFQVRKKLHKAGVKAKSIAVGTLSMGLGKVSQRKSRLGVH